VSTWSGWVYVAFVTDAYARMILGWRTSTSMTTQLVLDAVEHAIWTRGHRGLTDLGGVIHHTDAGSQVHLGPVRRAPRRRRDLGFRWQRWGFLR
jgi:putative transposase